LFAKKYRIFLQIGDSMIKRLFLIIALGVTVSGCFMAPMALIGPAASGFTTASIVQSGVTTGASYIIKQSTGKSVTEHVFEGINKEVLQQTYLPKVESSLIVAP